MRKTYFFGFRRWVCLLMAVCLFFSLPEKALGQSFSAGTKKTVYSFILSPDPMGEYNVTIKGGSMMTVPKVYYKNWRGKEVEVKNGIEVLKSGSRYILRCSFEKKKYYIKVTASSKPSCTYSRNRDRYSDSSSKMTKGISWSPGASSYQPYMTSGVTTRQIAYLTKEEALVYAMNMDKNVYLKVIDTSIRAAALLAAAGIQETSVLGKALSRVSRTKLASAAKRIVSALGGISFIPDIRKSIIEDIETKTKNYTTGLKVEVTWTMRGGCVNTYSTWNEKASSIYGKEYCRGSFTNFKKLEGWY